MYKRTKIWPTNTISGSFKSFKLKILEEVLWLCPIPTRICPYCLSLQFKLQKLMKNCHRCESADHVNSFNSLIESFSSSLRMFWKMIDSSGILSPRLYLQHVVIQCAIIRRPRDRALGAKKLQRSAGAKVSLLSSQASKQQIWEIQKHSLCFQI